MQNLGIEAALETLANKYPREEVRIAVDHCPGIGLMFVARIGEHADVVRAGKNLENVVQALIAEAGDRDPLAMKRKKISKLQAELAALETPEGSVESGSPAHPANQEAL